MWRGCCGTWETSRRPPPPAVLPPACCFLSPPLAVGPPTSQPRPKQPGNARLSLPHTLFVAAPALLSPPPAQPGLPLPHSYGETHP